MEGEICTENNLKTKKRKASRCCFVPNCTSGYNSNPEKRSMFGVPKDAELFRIWKSMIPRKDKQLSAYDVVCEKHFKEECIERYYRHVINGEEVLLKRGMPKLLDGALPTEYPTLPNLYRNISPFYQKRNPDYRKPDVKKPRIDKNNIMLDEKKCYLFNPKQPNERQQQFREDYTECFTRHVIDGEEVLLLRGKPKLVDDDLPTEYPGLPSFCLKMLPQELNPKCEELGAKNPRIDENNVMLDKKKCFFFNPKVPNEYWTKIIFQNQTHVYAFAVWREINTNVPVPIFFNPEKLVVVKEFENKTACCSTYINGCRAATDEIVDTVEDLQKLLSNVNAMTPCKGAGFLHEFSGIKIHTNDFSIQDNLIRHKSCKDVAISSSKCLSCKCARKRLLDKRSKLKIRNKNSSQAF